MILYPSTDPDWDELCSLDDAFQSAPHIDAPDEDAYEQQAPCPCCFESSGYMARVHPDTWSEPGWAEPDPTRPCEHCDGTGSVDAQPIDMADLAIMCGDAP